MTTLIIYDNEGKIFLQMSGTYDAPQGGIQYLEIDADTHKNKIITGVNVETKELIMEDRPKSDLEVATERIEALENYILEQESKNVTSSVE